jgi:hypothetical protein
VRFAPLSLWTASAPRGPGFQARGRVGQVRANDVLFILMEKDTQIGTRNRSADLGDRIAGDILDYPAQRRPQFPGHVWAFDCPRGADENRRLGLPPPQAIVLCLFFGTAMPRPPCYQALASPAVSALSMEDPGLLDRQRFKNIWYTSRRIRPLVLHVRADKFALSEGEFR